MGEAGESGEVTVWFGWRIGPAASLRHWNQLTPLGIRRVYIARFTRPSMDADHVIEWLRKAAGDREAELLWLKFDPHFEEFRRDPRRHPPQKRMRAQRATFPKTQPLTPTPLFPVPLSLYRSM